MWRARGNHQRIPVPQRGGLVPDFCSHGSFKQDENLITFRMHTGLFTTALPQGQVP
jgi:hypothetical protein